MTLQQLSDYKQKDLEQYGKYKAKIDWPAIKEIAKRPTGKLILVTAINLTPAGEGKSTVTIGLADGLNRIGKQTVIALREPSLGPVMGIKGGATGGEQSASLADGGHQSSFYRGHARNHCCE